MNDASNIESWRKLLVQLRGANDGYCLTIWGDSEDGDAGWKLWRTLDAKYAEGSPGWVMTIPLATIADEFEIALRTPFPSPAVETRR